MESLPELRSFLNAEGKLVALPAKKRKKLPALYFLSTKFEPNRDYTESEVNDILDSVYMRSSQNSQPNSDTPDMNSRKER